jgi:hypothetical protein
MFFCSPAGTEVLPCPTFFCVAMILSKCRLVFYQNRVQLQKSEKNEDEKIRHQCASHKKRFFFGGKNEQDTGTLL